MKSYILTFILLIAVQLKAGTLTDNANVFGPGADTVRKSLQSIPVWIETQVSTPTEGLKAFSDNKIAGLTNRGFLVVITTQPEI